MVCVTGVTCVLAMVRVTGMSSVPSMSSAPGVTAGTDVARVCLALLGRTVMAGHVLVVLVRALGVPVVVVGVVTGFGFRRLFP